MPEETNVPISSFPDASSIDGADKVTGLQNNLNTNFKFSTILAWLVNSLKNAFVPAGRTVNNKSLASDITLTAQDVGARPDNWTPSAADVGAIPTTAAGEPLGIAELDSSGKVPTNQLPAIPSQPSDIGAQEEITASGILKGDGAGGVSAAVAGTDYGTYSKPSGGIPSSDMTSAVQTSLGKADTAYQKPSGGIPATDIASGVIPSVPSISTSTPNMDGTGAAGSTGEVSDAGHVHPTDTSRVPVYGMGENLLRNAYFLNPVNQRGITTVTQRNVYTIDGWKTRDASYPGSVALTQNGIVITSSNNTNEWIEQRISDPGLAGKSVTLSVLTSDGLFTNSVASFPSTGTAISVPTTNGTAVCEWSGGTVLVSLRANVAKTVTCVAAKLEFGTQQTLCHNEGTNANPVWVLNEVPDYEEELIKCQTSTADSTDTYANKTLATEQQLAYVESGSTASRAYAVGEYFCWGGSLYRAIAYISVGATFTVGNCKATTATGMLKLFTNNFTTNANGRVSSGLYWSQGYIVAAWSQLKEIRIYSNATNAQGFWVLDNSGNSVGSTTVSITYLVYNYNL